MDENANATLLSENSLRKNYPGAYVGLNCHIKSLKLYTSLTPCFFWERATMGGWFLKEDKHKTL